MPGVKVFVKGLNKVIQFPEGMPLNEVHKSIGKTVAGAGLVGAGALGSEDAESGVISKAVQALKDKGSVSWEPNYQDYIGIDAEGDDILSAPYTLIEKVSTPKELRGQGIARQNMIDNLRTISEKHPDQPVRLSATPLDSDTDMDKLVEFYESLGFNEDKFVEGMDGIPMSMSPSTLKKYLVGASGSTVGTTGIAAEKEITRQPVNLLMPNSNNMLLSIDQLNKLPSSMLPDVGSIQGPIKGDSEVVAAIQDLGGLLSKFEVPVLGNPVQGLADYMQNFGYNDSEKERLKRAAMAVLDFL